MAFFSEQANADECDGVSELKKTKCTDFCMVYPNCNSRKTINNILFFFLSLCHFLCVFQQDGQAPTVTAIATIRSDEKVIVNGKEVNTDQPVKESKIEVIENKLTTNATQVTDIKPPTKLLEQKLTEPQSQPQAQQVQLIQASSGTPIKSTSKDDEKDKDKTEDETDTDEAETSIVTADYIQQSMCLIEEFI